MIIKSLQWNIGGGKTIQPGSDATKLSSYSMDGMDEIIALLQKHQPDIVTLQETHSAAEYSQTASIANALGYEDWVNDDYAPSHIERGQLLGQAIISRFPIEQHDFAWFTNPNLKTTWEDGSIVTSHDKGRTRCRLILPNGENMSVQTSHSTPLRRFGVSLDSPQALDVLKDMSEHFDTQGPGLIQGDFNVDTESLQAIFPTLFENGYKEVLQSEPTTPKHHRYDHVMYRSLELREYRTLSSVGTDHYPIVLTFETTGR